MAKVPHCSSYIEPALDPRKRPKLIKALVKAIKEHETFPQCEAVAVRGISGLLVGPEVAQKLGKPLAVCRKPKDGSHACVIVECCSPCDRYIIVDDITSTGGTVRAIIDAMEADLKATKPLAVFLYNSSGGDVHLSKKMGIPIISIDKTR